MTTETEMKPQSSPASISSSWTFFSNHFHVLVALHGEGHLTLREVSLKVGITERSVQKIVAELEAAGILSRVKIGRCNNYEVDTKVHLRHPLESHKTVGEILHFILEGK